MGLFQPAWESKDPKRRLRGIAKLEDQQLLANIAGTDGTEEIAVAALLKLQDQNVVAAVVQKTRHAKVFSQGLERLSEPAILMDLYLEHPNGYVDRQMSGLVLNRLLQLDCLGEYEWLSLINHYPEYVPAAKTLADKINNASQPLLAAVFAKIAAPSVLLEYQPTKPVTMLDTLYLTRLLEVAKDRPELLRYFRKKSLATIKANHQDTKKLVGGYHQDHKQLVRGSSSDCHEDNIPWTPAMTGFGHGYHQDGYSGGTNVHTDTYPLAERFRPFFKKNNA